MNGVMKNDLRSGMLVKTRNGVVYIVVLDSVIGDILVSQNGWNELDSYTETLHHSRFSHFDIVSVYTSDCGWSWHTESMQELCPANKMTKAEIEKALGYKVEIVE